MLTGKMTTDGTADMWEADHMLTGKTTTDGTTDMWEAVYSNNKHTDEEDVVELEGTCRDVGS